MKVVVSTCLFCLASFFSLLTGTSPVPSLFHYMGTMPVEMRDYWIDFLDAVSYGSYLKTAKEAKTVSATEYAATLILKKAALEVKSLVFDNYDDRIRLMEILSGVQTIVRIHFKVSDKPSNTSQAMNLIESRLDFFRSLSEDLLWNGACWAGLVTIDMVNDCFDQFSPSFIMGNATQMVFMACWTGNLQLLNRLIQAPVSWSSEVCKAAVIGIALHGSYDFMTTIGKHVPTLKRHHVDIIVAAMALKRNSLFETVINTVLLSIPKMNRKTMILEILIGASAVGRLDIVKDLFQCYLDSIPEDYLERSLTKAAQNGNLSIVKYLLTESEYRYLDVSIHETVLVKIITAATAYQQIAVIDFILFEYLASRRDFRAKLIPPALATAAANSSLKILDRLLGRDRFGNLLVEELDFGSDRNSLLSSSLISDCTDVIEYLLARKHDTDSRFHSLDLSLENNIILRRACSQGRPQILRFLLRVDSGGNLVIPGIDPAAQKNEALRMACKNGHLDIVQELLKTDQHDKLIFKTVRVDTADNGPLRIAVAYDQVHIVKFLLQLKVLEDGSTRYKLEGVDPTVNNQYILCNAVENGRTEMVQFLLKHKGEGFLLPGLAIPDQLLQLAVQLEHLSIVEILLQCPLADRKVQIEQAIGSVWACRNSAVNDLLQRALQASQTRDNIARFS